MLEVHKKGKGIAGTYTYEVAEMKAIETLEAAKREQHPLQAVVERA
jgi:ATP-dependent Clp protease adaptor protein ClpS